MPGLKSTYIRSILILNLFVALRTLAPKQVELQSIARDIKSASEQGPASSTPLLEKGNGSGDLEEENVPDERQDKNKVSALLSKAKSGIRGLFSNQEKPGFMQLGRTQAINSPVPEEFSIPEIRKMHLGTPEFLWAEETLQRFEPLIQFAKERELDLSSKRRLPAFYATISGGLRGSSISAVPVQEKIKCLDELIQLQVEMKDLDSDIDREVETILNLFHQPEGKITSIMINSGSAGSPLAKYPDFITLVELLGSDTIREINPLQPSMSEVNQLCEDLGLEKHQINNLIFSQDLIKQRLATIKGPDVTKEEYLQIVSKLDEIRKMFSKNTSQNSKAIKQLQKLLAPFPFMYKQSDLAHQLFPAELDLPRLLIPKVSQKMTPPLDDDPFLDLKKTLREHNPETLPDRRKIFEERIQKAYNNDRHIPDKKDGTKVPWEEVMKRVKMLQGVRADLFPKDRKAAQVEFLLRFYSLAHPFSFNSPDEAELLGLNSPTNLPNLRAAVGRFRLATREKWLRVQRLRRVSDIYADITRPGLHSFIDSVTEALDKESLPSLVPPAEPTNLL